MRRIVWWLFLLTCALAASPVDSTDPASIDEVYIVFSNHFDAGFNHGLDELLRPCLQPPYHQSCGYTWSVVANYFRNYFPLAVRTAEQLNERGGEQQLIYTTQSWLVNIYVDCEAYAAHWPEIKRFCPSAEALSRFKAAVRKGWISWHAFPFNALNSVAHKDIFRLALNVTSHLQDHVFPDTAKKTVMSQRDVPGVSRAVIPLLAAQGVRAINVGVNQACSPPDVPRVFVWRDPQTDTEIFASFHKGGYGYMLGTNEKPTDCLMVGSKAQCAAWKNDNHGPPNATEVGRFWDSIRRNFPNAKLRVATFEDFVPVLESHKHLLPVFTGEIDDQWNYGQATDPKKLRHFRALTRATIGVGDEYSHTNEWHMYAVMLIKAFEHTYGMDIKNFMPGFNTSWNNPVGQYPVIEFSWDEQRSLLNIAQTLGEKMPALAHRIKREMSMINDEPPSLAGYTRVSVSSVLSLGGYTVAFAKSGALVRFRTPRGAELASATRRLAELHYHTFSSEFVQRKWLDKYLFCPPSQCSWGPLDLGKPGLPNTTETHDATPVLTELYHNAEKHSLVAKLETETGLVSNYGAPQSYFVTYDFSRPSEIDMVVLWMHKGKTRLPESLGVLWNPVTTSGDAWLLDMMGSQWVSPLDVARNASRNLHATWDGAKTRSLQVSSLDASLVAPGDKRLYNYDNELPCMDKGVSFMLTNNLWDTNTPVYFPWKPQDSSLSFRFNFKYQQ